MKSILKLDIGQLFGETIHIKESFDFKDIGLHWHSYYELIYYFEGGATSCINGNNLELNAGSLYLVTPADMHHTHTNAIHKNAHFLNISFTEDVIDRELVGQLQYVLYMHNAQENILPLIQLLKSAKNTKEKQHLLNALLYRMVTQGTNLTASAGYTLPDSVYQGMRYITNHFKEPITLESVAQTLHLNASYFSAVFSKTYGCTFKTYLTNFRLGYAKHLLQNTSLSVTEICTASGFQSLPHFLRTFKQKEGVTPLQFKNKLK